MAAGSRSREMILPLGANSLGQGASVPPTSKCTINEHAAGLGVKPRKYFSKHYGHVNGTLGGHGLILRPLGGLRKVPVARNHR